MTASTTRTVDVMEDASGLVLRFTWSADEQVEPVVRFIGARGRGVPASVITLAFLVLRDPAQLGRDPFVEDSTPPPAPSPPTSWWRRLFRRTP